MSDLTDLEIAKKIAEIDKKRNPYLSESREYFRYDVDGLSVPYHPMLNHLNCMLRDEFEVEIDYSGGLVECWKDNIVLSQIPFNQSNKNEINKAVCLAIIEAFGELTCIN